MASVTLGQILLGVPLSLESGAPPDEPEPEVPLDFSALPALSAADQARIQTQAYAIAEGQTDYEAQTAVDLLSKKLTSAWLFKDSSDYGLDSYGDNNGDLLGAVNPGVVFLGDASITGSDRNNGIFVPDSPTLRTSGDSFSVSIWVRLTVAPVGLTPVISKDRTPERGIVIFTSGLTLNGFFGLAGNAGSTLPAGQTLTVGQWHLITLYWDSTTGMAGIKLDVRSPATAAIVPISTDEPLTFGRHRTSGPFSNPDAEIGPCYWFKDILTEAEQALLYGQGTGNLIPLPL